MSISRQPRRKTLKRGDDATARAGHIAAHKERPARIERLSPLDTPARSPQSFPPQINLNFSS
jgi:hypothetical protein